FTAGDRHDPPERVRAPQRGALASISGCMDVFARSRGRLSRALSVRRASMHGSKQQEHNENTQDSQPAPASASTPIFGSRRGAVTSVRSPQSEHDLSLERRTGVSKIPNSLATVLTFAICAGLPACDGPHEKAVAAEDSQPMHGNRVEAVVRKTQAGEA